MAHRNLLKYTVTIDPDNGIDPVFSVEIKHGEYLDFDISIKKGHEFAGVRETTEGANSAVIMTEAPRIYHDSSYIVVWKQIGYIQDIKITGVSDMQYTGAAVTLPGLKITDGDYKLINCRDYTVRYSNNVNVGKATALITYKGIYTGKSSLSFNITKADIAAFKAKGTITSSFEETVLAYNKKLQKAKPVLTLSAGGKKLVLKENRDYKLIYAGTDKNAEDYSADAFREAGTYNIRVVGMGNFEGDFSLRETITTDKLVSKLAVSGLKKSYPYTGKEITPSFEVKDGRTVIGAYVIDPENGKGSFVSDFLDYSIGTNTALGTATITISAKKGKTNID